MFLVNANASSDGVVFELGNGPALFDNNILVDQHTPMHTRTHICPTRTHTHVCTQPYRHAHTHILTHTYSYTRTHMHVHTRTHARAHAHTH